MLRSRPTYRSTLCPGVLAKDTDGAFVVVEKALRLHPTLAAFILRPWPSKTLRCWHCRHHSDDASSRETLIKCRQKALTTGYTGVHGGPRGLNQNFLDRKSGAE